MNLTFDFRLLNLTFFVFVDVDEECKLSEPKNMKVPSPEQKGNFIQNPGPTIKYAFTHPYYLKDIPYFLQQYTWYYRGENGRWPGDTTFDVDHDVTIFYALDSRSSADYKYHPAGFQKTSGILVRKLKKSRVSFHLNFLCVNAQTQ